MITTTPGSDQNGPEPDARGSAPAALIGTAPVGNLRRASLVVLPTYNERENLESIVMTVLERGHDVLIVDDNSPDGTGDIADRLSACLVGVSVLHRAQKLGLGSAYREGFQVALEQEYEFILEMDADGSHLPNDLERLIEAARVSNGLVIGSRYIAGGTIIGWSVKRRLLSKAANIYSGLLFGHRLHDWTSGYRCYSSRALRTVELETILSNGFDFQIEMAYRCLELGVPVTEVPIQFKERELGQSKASALEIQMGLARVAWLRRARSRKRAIKVTAGHENPVVAQLSPAPLELCAGDLKHPLESTVVGVLVHNEEATIGACLRAILAELDGQTPVQSVVVVASGCTDATTEIVNRIAHDDARIRLIVEAERSGKVAAINLLLQESSAPIVVTLGGDMVFTRGSLVKMLEPFKDPTVGMTGVRPVPTNPRKGMVGNVVNILWDVHHELSMDNPKLGEAVAFRRLIPKFDDGTVFDEATMERLIRSAGLQLRYVPEATVRNHGPETLDDYLRHRSRNIREHLAMASTTGYHVATLSVPASGRAIWRLWRRGESARYLALAVGLEALAVLHARLSLMKGRPDDNVIWRPISSSKRVVANGQVLRAHHDSFHTLHIRLVHVRNHNTQRDYHAIREIRKLVRVDDRIRHDRDRIAITVRCDQGGVGALCARLETALPHLVVGMV